MKLARLLFLLVGLNLPAVVKAQMLSPKTVPLPQPTDVAKALEGVMNPRYKVLERPTPVYRQPADTLNGHHALIATPGTKVFIRKGLAHGLLITFFYGGSEEYYLPAKSVEGLPTLIEL
jgi:hypothetical protein